MEKKPSAWFGSYECLSQFLHRTLQSAPQGVLFRARLLAGLCLVTCTFTPLLYLSMFSHLNDHFLSHSIGFALLQLGALLALGVLRWLGLFRLAALLLLLSALAGLSIFAWTERVAVSGTYFWFTGLGLFGLYVLGLQLGKYWCASVLLVEITLIFVFKDSPNLTAIGMTRADFVRVFSADVIGVTLGIWTIAALYELQRHRYARELEAAQADVLLHREKLMQGARLTELGQMAGGVAHEINNPLAIVHGYAIRLKRDLEEHGALTPEQKVMFESMERSCLRIATISRALLSYAHEGSYEQDVVFTLHRLEEEFNELCRERMRSRNIQLTVECHDAERPLYGQYVKLLQVIVNLLNNAIDAANAQVEKWIHLELDLRPEQLHIVMTDSGPGIPEHLWERIKSPFFTTKPIGQGTGLGLAIVDGIVRSLGGQFYLDTQAPHTRFVVGFPLSSLPAEP